MPWCCVVTFSNVVTVERDSKSWLPRISCTISTSPSTFLLRIKIHPSCTHLSFFIHRVFMWSNGRLLSNPTMLLTTLPRKWPLYPPHPSEPSASLPAMLRTPMPSIRLTSTSSDIHPTVETSRPHARSSIDRTRQPPIYRPSCRHSANPCLPRNHVVSMTTESKACSRFHEPWLQRR